MSAHELPPELSDVLKSIESLLTDGEVDPEVELSMAWITRYLKLAAQKKAAHISMMILNRAGVVMSATHLKGVLD